MREVQADTTMVGKARHSGVMSESRPGAGSICSRTGSVSSVPKDPELGPAPTERCKSSPQRRAEDSIRHRGVRASLVRGAREGREAGG